MPLETKIGQMLMAGVYGTAWSTDAAWIIDELHIGNVILMGRNAGLPKQVLAFTRELQNAAVRANGVGVLIATDQEGGAVQRFGPRDAFTGLPSAATVGATGDPGLIERYGAMVGHELAAVGVNMDLAPNLDVHDNPDNPVIGRRGRAFGSTPAQVAAAGVAFLRGLHAAGLIAAGKHFPGHGHTSVDSHKALPTVAKSRAELEAVELPPFQAAIAAGIDTILPAHVAYPALDPSGSPATVSAAIQTGLLRRQLDFGGIIITDDMSMKGITGQLSAEESAVQAVLAGADIVTCVRMLEDHPGEPDRLPGLRAGLLAAVRDGRIPLSRIDDSVARILALKRRYQVGPAEGVGLSEIGGADHAELVAEVRAAARER